MLGNRVFPIDDFVAKDRLRCSRRIYVVPFNRARFVLPLSAVDFSPFQRTSAALRWRRPISMFSFRRNELYSICNRRLLTNENQTMPPTFFVPYQQPPSTRVAFRVCARVCVFFKIQKGIHTGEHPTLLPSTRRRTKKKKTLKQTNEENPRDDSHRVATERLGRSPPRPRLST